MYSNLFYDGEVNRNVQNTDNIKLTRLNYTSASILVKLNHRTVILCLTSQPLSPCPRQSRGMS